MTTATDILSFWFGDSFQQGMPTGNRNDLWFGSDPAVDELIKQQYADDVRRASQGHYDHWKSTPEGRLAIIILLDQFTRNIYRGTKEAFAYDSIALSLCLEGLERGHDQQLMPVYRCFFYLPLEHSESQSLQERCVKLFENFYQQADPAIKEKLKSSLDFAKQHYEIIARFGRFPHRNAVLGRVSTAEERTYLKESGITFGQGS